MMRKRRKNLSKVVRVLRQRRIIAKGSYYDYMSLILSAETPDQLEEIAIDFAEICYSNQGRLDKRAGEKEEETIQRDTKVWGEPGVFVDVWI